MDIGLVFDLQTDPFDERQAEYDPPATIEALSGALRSLGHRVVSLGGPAQLMAAPLDDLDLVFNIAEGGIAGSGLGRCREAWAPAILEQRGMPYVGSGPATLAISLDKVRCKQIA